MIIKLTFFWNAPFPPISGRILEQFLLKKFSILFRFFEILSTTFGRIKVEKLDPFSKKICCEPYLQNFKFVPIERGLFAVGHDCSQPRTVGSPRT